MNNIPILLLAAGASSRMGKPKPLLPWEGKRLIEHQVNMLLSTGNPVVVVLGNQSESIIPIIQGLPVEFTINESWEQGMGTSIATGVRFISQLYPDCKGVMITLIDQPLITSDHLNTLVTKFEPNNQQIIVSQANSGWQGVPVLFDRFYFDELARLNGKQGAKTIFWNYKEQVISVPCGEILVDMDTPKEYDKLQNISKEKQSGGK
nr:nucleotidyltransferase family protein [uncultured Draconibacterium sp.]